MIAEADRSEEKPTGGRVILPEAPAGQGCDWATLVQLARRVIESACLAVVAHGELDEAGETGSVLERAGGAPRKVRGG